MEWLISGAPCSACSSQSRQRTRQALRETVWTYTALCQGKAMTPWWQTDFPLLHYRVPSWIAWRYRIRGLLYWGGMSYWNDVAAPWIDPGGLSTRKKPRRPRLQRGRQSRLSRPAPPATRGSSPRAFRLKALRDSIEDYEYLCIMERLGQADGAMKVVVPLAGSWTSLGHRPGCLREGPNPAGRGDREREESTVNRSAGLRGEREHRLGPPGPVRSVRSGVQEATEICGSFSASQRKVGRVARICRLAEGGT